MNLVLVCAVIIFVSLPLQATELIWISPSEISSIQVASGESKATYSLRTKGGWQPSSSYASKAGECPHPANATIDSTQKGADALLSLALTAKTTKAPVTLVGVCGYHEAYFEIKRIIF